MRQIAEYTKMALRNIVGNKMRSLLTMLGIIIGIAAVIVVLGLGGGGQQTIEQELSGIANGSAYIMVFGDDATDADKFTKADVAAIQQMPGISNVTMISGANGSARGTREDVGANIMTGTGSMHMVLPSTLVSGRYWSESENEASRRVCTVDETGAKELFGSSNVLGMPVRLTVYGRSAEYTIVGLTKSTQMNIGGNVTADFRIPNNTMEAISDQMGEPYQQIALLAEDPDQSNALSKQAVDLIEMRHNNSDQDAYFIMDVGQYMAEINTVMTLFTTIIAAIASISLLVGGIGVMNIMLVSVTERTREIGIRKALGAKTRTILFQFLVESATLTLVGGVIGIILGLLGGRALGGAMGIEASISPQLIIFVALFSSVIGIFFGIYPARKAARLNPIDALRSD